MVTISIVLFPTNLLNSQAFTLNFDMNSDLFVRAPEVILWIVLSLTALFSVYFLYKYSVTHRNLASAVMALGRRGKDHNGLSPKGLNAVFAKQPLIHIWSEYSETLHPMRMTHGESGQYDQYRSTVPAESMFTKEALVEGALFDDFWRHLPGILTGLGIIGTFAGLLHGLNGFQQAIDQDMDKAAQALGPLLAAVMHAFTVSAVAIACAMLVVFFSRFGVALLNAKVDNLCQLVDSMYDSGAGEEYLQRLVESSENSEVHTAQLKDALVEDLTRLMTNLTERQISAQINAGKDIGEAVGKSIAESIAEPMQRVREVMESNATGNSAQVSNMLETMLTGFMAKLEDTFGGQIKGLNDQMAISMTTMASVETSLKDLVMGIEKASTSGTEKMSDQLSQAMTAAADHQAQMAGQMSKFAADFNRLVEDDQRKSKDTLNETVTNLLQEVGRSISSLEASREAASKADEDRTTDLTAKTTQMVSGLSVSIDDLMKAVTDQILKTQENIDAVRDVSIRAVDGMNQGAVNLGTAAQRFETAGSSVSNAFDRSAEFITQVKTSANSLQAASNAVAVGFEKYDATRSTVDSQVIALTGLVELAKREVGASKELITGIEASVKALRDAEVESRNNLNAVNDQLVQAFETFGNSLVSQVQRVVGETDKNISVLSNQLTGVVQELAQFMQRMRKQ